MKLLFVLLFSSISFSASASTSGQVSSGQTGFLAVGKPGFLKIKGEGPAPTGKFTANGNLISAELEVELGLFKTGIGLRDTHMKDNYLEVQKFPKAKLTIKDLKLDEPFETVKSGELNFKGTLALHGVEKPVEGKIKFKKEGKSVTTESRFDFTISDFEIAIPSHLGVTVAKEVTVNVEAKFDVQ